MTWKKPILSMLVAMMTAAGCLHAIIIHDAQLAGISGWASGVWIMSSLMEFGEVARLKLKVAEAANRILAEAEKKGLL